MLSGRGDQEWMKKSFQDDKNRALEDRTTYTDAELERLEITTIDKGGGETDSDNFRVKQFPFPLDTAIRAKKEYDLRYVNKKVGE